MGLAVGQRHAEVDDRVAVADAALHLGTYALLDRGDEVAGYGAPDDLVDELEPAALRKRLDLDVAHGVLAVAAGLLDVPPVALGGAAERLAQGHHERHLLDVHRVALGQPFGDDLRVGLAHAPDHQLVGLAVVLDADARVLRGEAAEGLGELVLVGLAGGDDGDRQQRLGHRPRPQYPRVVDVRQGVAGLGPGEPADGAQVARHDGFGGHLGAAERVGECPDLLVLVVVLVALLGTEERGEVAGDVHRLVGGQGSGEDADQAQPADVRVAGRLHDLGDERSLGVALDRVALGSRGREDLGRGMFLRRREAGHREVEQLGAADTGLRADRHDREERRPGHGRLEVVGEHLRRDLLAAEIAVHQGLVLGLLDDALDEGPAQVLVAAVAGLEQPRQRGDLTRIVALRHVERHHLVAERRLGLGEHAVVVGSGLVELGDHHRPWHADVGALAPQGLGAVVDPVVGGDHEQRAVGGPQPGAYVAHEVGVPGGVDEVDLGLAMDHRRDGQGDGAAVLLLGLVEVADGGAVLDGPGSGDGPR